MAMKHLTLALIGVALLAVAVLGAGGVAAASLPDVPGLQPQSVQNMSRHLNLRSASKGRISETETYQTTDTLAVVLARYTGLYQLEPGRPKAGQCVLLRKANSYYAFHQTVLITVCPTAQGTQVIFSRNYYLGS